MLGSPAGNSVTVSVSNAMPSSVTTAFESAAT